MPASQFGVFASRLKAKPFVTAASMGSARNNFAGPVGYRFTVGGSSIKIYALGRWCISGNSATHTVKIITDNDFSDVASVSISMSGATASAYNFVNLATPVTLASGTTYSIASYETNGGDQWYDYGTLTVTGAASIYGPTYQDGLGTWSPSNVSGQGYGPLNFKYV